LGRDNNNPSQPTRRIVIKNNLFAELGGPRWGGEGRLFQLLDGTTSVVIDHNTAMHVGTIITAEGPPHRDFVFTNNIVAHNTYGITGSGVGQAPVGRRTPAAAAVSAVAGPSHA